MPMEMFLFHDPGEATSPLAEVERIVHPIECLDRAVESPPWIIVIHVALPSPDERNQVIVLCASLKRNRYTKTIPVLAVLAFRHREFIERLRMTGIEYVRYTEEMASDPVTMLESLKNLGMADHVNRRVEELCPFLHYHPIDSRHEIITCGAYRDRLVLGGRRLAETCLSHAHIQCEYHRYPRSMS